jgi:hypothetical protein
LQTHKLFQDAGNMTSVLICPNPECKQALATSTLPGRFRCPNCNWILQIRFTPEGVVLQQATAGDSSSQIPVAPATDTPPPPALAAAPVTQTPPTGSNLLLYILLGVLILMVVAVIAIVVIVITSNRGPGITTHRAATAQVQEERVGESSRACVISPNGFLRSS